MSELPAPRGALLGEIADRITAAGAVRVAVDGVDAAGKSIFADELAGVLRRAGADVVRVSIDGFPADQAAPENRRYRVGQQLYLDACDPESRADAVVDNTEPGSPWLVDGGQRNHGPGTPGHSRPSPA